jgi:SAM-dependent methyltransferase
MKWRDVTTNPMSDEALDLRRAQLAGAWRPFDDERRDEVLSRLCAGLRVLDIGCTDEGAYRLGALHQVLVAAASDCVGVDYDRDGVEALAAAGAQVMYADVTQPAPPDLVAVGPFDRVVAGEVIEHLNSPDQLLRFASEVLADDGLLLLTTPNPYALHRARAGWGHIVWENVDHVTYLFPSGICELAARTGLRLEFYGTCVARGFDDGNRARRSFRQFSAAKLRGAELPAWYVPPYVPWLRPRDRPMMRETIIYGLVKS